MRASRLLAILLTLHNRGRVSARELADEHEVSVRTIYRDVEALGAAGIPVYATRGRLGGFALLDGYRTRLTGLTTEEADALFLAGLPGAAADLGLGTVVAATSLKLLAALPPQLRERAERIRDRFHLDAPGWERTAEQPPFLETIAGAVWSQQVIEVGYQRSGRDLVERRLEPLGLVLKAGVWYLLAAVDGGRPRTYRLIRMRSVHVTDVTFDRPDGFDLAGQWDAYQRDYEARLFHGTALIRLSEKGRSLLFLIGSTAARAGHAAMGEPDATGWATTSVPIESVRHAQHALQQLGADVEVLEPPELRRAIVAEARAVLTRYGDSGGGPAVSADGVRVSARSTT